MAASSAYSLLNNCSYDATMADVFSAQTAIDVTFGIYACSPFKWEYAVAFLIVILWLIVARWLYDFYMRLRRASSGKPPFKLAEELTKRDNPALAIDFASFLFSICLITRGSLTDLPPALGNAQYFGAFFLYQGIGVAVILGARLLNDKLMLRKVNNLDAMIDERSVAVGCVQAGATISTALIFAASASGVGTFGPGVVLTLIYWAVGQCLLIVYGNAVDCLTSLPALTVVTAGLLAKSDKAPTTTTIMPTFTEGVGGPPAPFSDRRAGMTAAAAAASSSSTAASETDSEPGGAGVSSPSSGGRRGRRSNQVSLLTEAAAGNAAAGLAIGLDMAHAGVIIAAPIYVGYELLPLLAFVFLSLCLISPIMHVYMDHLVMRGEAYNVSILRFRNWGSSLLVGGCKLLLALVLSQGYQTNCSPSTAFSRLRSGGGEVCILKLPASPYERLLVPSLPNIFTYQYLLNLALVLVLLILAKGLYWGRVKLAQPRQAPSVEGEPPPHHPTLDAVLADPSNNAVAVSLAAYIFAQGLLIVGIVVCPDDNAGDHGGALLLWTAIGLVLLLIAFLINDTILLAKVSNTQGLLDDNVAIAAYEGGSLIACGVILRASLTGSGDGFTLAQSIGLTAVFWAVSQVVLLLFAYAYRVLTPFDDYKELLHNNVAAGLSGGVTLVSLSIVMAYPIMLYASLATVVPMAMVGAVALLIVRKIVDLAILPGDNLDSEIEKDHNWGAAIIEGGVAIGIALVTNMYVPPPGAPYVSDELPYFDVCG